MTPPGTWLLALALLIGSLELSSAPIVVPLQPALTLSPTDYLQTRRTVERFTGAGAPELQRTFSRFSRYRPCLVEQLDAYRLPRFLQYITLAESRAIQRAVSPAGAAGLWQLMPETARAYGLRVDERVDERMDPYRCTEAALALLSDLYSEFRNWALVLAAYNCGPTRVRSLLNRSSSGTYAGIRQQLPGQTRAYVPRFLAYMTIAESRADLPGECAYTQTGRRNYVFSPAGRQGVTLSESLLMSYRRTTLMRVPALTCV